MRITAYTVMRTLLTIVLAASTISSIAQQPSVSGKSSGDCSPNVLANSGGVQFVCKTAIDEQTTKKIVSLLNQLLKKENKETATQTESINHKLDEILDFLKNEARHLTPTQKTALAASLKAIGPESFYLLSAPDAEATHFSNELLFLLTSPEVGWKQLPQPPGQWGMVFHQGEGLFIVVADLQKPPRGTVELQLAFKSIGVEANGLSYPLIEPDKFALYVGVRPASHQ
jgi:hypothetical protein